MPSIKSSLIVRYTSALIPTFGFEMENTHTCTHTASSVAQGTWPCSASIHSTATPMTCPDGACACLCPWTQTPNVEGNTVVCGRAEYDIQPERPLQNPSVLKGSWSRAGRTPAATEGQRQTWRYPQATLCDFFLSPHI